MKLRIRTWLVMAVPASLALILVFPAGTVLGKGGESRAQVRLVRLLEEFPDSERATLGNVHDLRLRLERGNILLLRSGGHSAALMPIERTEGAVDSLRYFYYVQNSPFLWIFPGEKARGIGTVGDRGTASIEAFRVLWRAGGDLGWIYFPNDPSSGNVRFSVVSGRTVDEADPMDTKYWIELGPAEASGF